MNKFEPELFKWYKVYKFKERFYRLFFKRDEKMIYMIDVPMHDFGYIETQMDYIRFMYNRYSDHTLLKRGIPEKFRKDVVKYLFEGLYEEA